MRIKRIFLLQAQEGMATHTVTLMVHLTTAHLSKPFQVGRPPQALTSGDMVLISVQWAILILTPTLPFYLKAYREAMPLMASLWILNLYCQVQCLVVIQQMAIQEDPALQVSLKFYIYWFDVVYI